MSKQLFEEALADVKKVKQVAEDNAKRAILEAVTPRIRDFIDRALLQEDEHAQVDLVPGKNPPGHEHPDNSEGGAGSGEDMVVTDVDVFSVDDVDDSVPPDAITAPDAEGKVTLDIDALCSTEPGAAVPPPQFGAPAPSPEDEYEINLESIDALQPVLSAAKKKIISPRELTGRINKMIEQVNLFTKAGKAVRGTSSFSEQIAQMISNVENMYDYVQESVTDSRKKSSYETTLEAGFKVLNKLQESMTMSQKTNKRRMNEADVTLKLTGLPDDVDLDTVGVDLITGEEDEDGGGDDLDLDGLDGGDEDGGGQGGDDVDLGDLGMGDQSDSDEGDTQMENRRLSDDTIVEIDENMLRREISRMRNLREETDPQSWGNGPDHFDSFGGGKDDGEALDAEIVDKSTSPGALPLGEADGEDLEEQDDLDESDDLEESDDMEEADMPPAAVQVAEAKKRIAFEKKLQERAKSRARSLKKEAAVAKSRRNARRFNECKKEYAVVAKRFNESVSRSKKASQIVAVATRKLQESRSNSRTARPAENTVENASLRKKLAETNLFNAKLLYTNKLLQNEQLTSRQKAQVIQQLDTAKTSREAKLVYESLANTLAGSSKTVNESADRKVLGSGSRATRPSSTQSLNEGYEAERWAKLAGIVK